MRATRVWLQLLLWPVVGVRTFVTAYLFQRDGMGGTQQKR